MVAHGRNREGKPTVTQPVVRDEQGRPLEPHIGSTYLEDPKPATRQTGIVRGGTSNPPVGQSGAVEWMDPDGTVRRTHEPTVERNLPDGVNVRSDTDRGNAWTDDDPGDVQKVRAQRTSDRHPELQQQLADEGYDTQTDVAGQADPAKDGGGSGSKSKKGSSSSS